MACGIYVSMPVRVSICDSPYVLGPRAEELASIIIPGWQQRRDRGAEERKALETHGGRSTLIPLERLRTGSASRDAYPRRIRQEGRALMAASGKKALATYMLASAFAELQRRAGASTTALHLLRRGFRLQRWSGFEVGWQVRAGRHIARLLDDVFLHGADGGE